MSGAEMLAVFSQPDALVIVALIGGFGSWWQSYRNGKKLRPNGGSSPVDGINRSERKIDQALKELKAVAADVKQLHGRVDDLEEVFTNPPAQGHIRRRNP